MLTKDMWKKAADKGKGGQRRSSIAGQRKPGSGSRDGPPLPELSPISLRIQSSVEDYNAEVDTDLFVGPVYTDDSTRKQNVIKEQLGEITQRLHRTLKDFDNIADFEENPHREVLNNMTRRINKLENSEMKGELEQFLDQYQHLSQTYEEASKERDEILMDLADWFTTDHTDLDHKLGLDESEESDIKKGYVETLANFEKIKRLTESIKAGGSQGKNVKHLEEEKKKLEKNVVTGFKRMSNASTTVSVQTKPQKDDTWKFAADEIMSLITNVRTENSAEMAALSKKMRDMVTELERQELQIKALQSENRRLSEVKKCIADENSELNNDNLTLRGKICRFEKDLENAKKMLEKQFKELAQKEQSKLTGDEASESSLDGEAKTTVSGLIGQFFGDDNGAGLRRMSSDPVILRSRIRELDTNVDQLNKELVQLNDRLEEYEEEFERLEEETAELQKENKDLSNQNSALEDREDQLESKLEILRQAKLALEEQLEEALAKSAANNRLSLKPSISSQHACSRCNCHLRSMMSIPMLEEEPSIPLEKKVSEAETKQLMDKCAKYRRMLAETEMKLSNAYRDIAELRLQRELHDEKPVYPSPEPAKPEVRPKQEHKKEPAHRPVTAPEHTAEEADITETLVQSSEKGPPVARITELTDSDLPKLRKEKPKKSAKPQPKKESPASLKKKESPVSLPPIQQPLPREEPPEDTKDRDLVLWHVGDLQGRLNMVIQEIMEFVKMVAEVLHKEEAEHASKLPTLTTFEFGSRSDQKKKKKEDPKELEMRQRKAQIALNGQRAVALMRDVYDMMSNSLNLQHDEYELIYRSFKANQHRRALERAVMLGQLPPSALNQLKELQEEGLKETYKITSFGKGHHQFSGGISQFGYMQGGGPAISGGGGAGWVNPADQSLSQMSNESERQKLEEAVMVVGMHRSKSEIDVQSVMSEGSLPSQTMVRERSSVFVVHMPESRAAISRKESAQPNREEIKVSKTVTTKKGLIKLTSLDYELKNQFAFENKALLEKDQTKRKHRPAPQKMLIKRKDIADQIKMGNKQLQEQNVQGEEDAGNEKQIGEYTFADLQMNIDQLTDSSKRRTGFRGKTDPRRQQQHQNKEPKDALPQISTLKPFGT